jgi:hypothetical protein
VSVEIEIKGQGGGIGIAVLGYENVEAENRSDANWLVCRVHLGIGALRGDFRATFTTDDFVAFASELRALLEGHTEVATFDPYEEALTLKVEMARTGTARISGMARHEGPEVVVSFVVDSDQSYLSNTVRGLDEVTKQFPVRT